MLITPDSINAILSPTLNVPFEPLYWIVTDLFLSVTGSELTILYVVIIPDLIWSIIGLNFFSVVLNVALIYKDLYPELYNIQNYGIEDEIKNIIEEKNWDDWPEPSLYKNEKIDGNWKILPFVTFSVWNDENCAKFPKLTKFLKTIPNFNFSWFI